MALIIMRMRLHMLSRQISAHSASSHVYVGIIKHQLDLPLVASERHRQWSFVLVGPQPSGSGLLDPAALTNAQRLLLGGKPVDALPAYVQHGRLHAVYGERIHSSSTR
jgi:hypothetical protein